MQTFGRASMAELGGWPGVLHRLGAGETLGEDEAAAVMDEVLSGEASPAQIAALAMALRVRGETSSEIAGMVRAMLARAELLEVPEELRCSLVDTCGTGGDGSSSVNISTMAALVVAGAGAPVCKHGGRAASSLAGSADVLEALGVVIDLGPSGVQSCLKEAGVAFCFAPRFHPAMRHAAPVRRELGVRTVFNLLGPLANPARVPRQVVGVSDPSVARAMIEVLAANGARRAMVVWGHDGLDELSTLGPSETLSLEEDGALRQATVDPAALGLPAASPEQLRGGDARCNAAALRSVLAGEHGPQRDVVALNAAAGLVVAGLAGDLAAGLELAFDTIDCGRAASALERLVSASRRAALSG